MSYYTPTLDELFEGGVSKSADAEFRKYARIAFDRRIAEVERAAAERAWHEGFCVGERSGEREMSLNPYTENPYRREETE